MAGRPLIRRAAALLAVFLAAGCVNFRCERLREDRVPEEGDAAVLVVGQSRLEDVLERLGSPIAVEEGARGGMILSYGGLAIDRWALTVRITVARGVSPWVTYGEGDSRREGYILLLDEDRILRDVRRGNLRDLRAELE